ALGKGYIAVAAACVLSTVMGYPGPLEHHPRPEVWSSLLIECLSGIACVLRLTMSNLEEERDALTLLAVAGTSALIWTLAPLPIVSVMWLALAIVMLEFARRFRSVPFGWIGTAEAALALCRICVADLENPDKWGHVPVAALTAGAFIAGLYFVYSQLGWLSWRRLARLTSWCAAALYAGITIAQANYNNYAVWWAGGMVALLLASRIFRENDFRYQACALSGLTLASTVLTNLSPVNLWVSIPVVTALYTSWFIVGRGSQKNLPLYFSGAGTVLMALVLYHAVSGSILTVAWGIEGAALLCAGFPLRDRVLRLQGLAAFLFCTLKLFFYDLRNLETPYRIVSFIALGGILLGVSWTYSRFREQLRRIL
ncbi:MAG TPA: DUF2339 domain-containing protein, partial [Bryobacteraceae bacterium]|nr:DUF2339 domain-containing protein [Bryobacteraceae bacterium]